MARITLLLLAALCLLLSSASGAQAQDTPPLVDGDLTVAPGRLTIATAGGCPPLPISCLQTFQLVLRATGPVDGLRPVPTDLRRADGTNVLPASAIISVLAKDNVAPGEVVTMTVRVDLARVDAGSYTGDLLLVRPAGTTSVPMTVQVRDWWLTALLVLAGALAAGIWFNHYRERNQPRDDLIVQAGYLEQELNADEGLPEFYRRRLGQQLAAARSALQFGRQPEASAAVGLAQDLWRRWQGFREDWIKLASHLGQLRAALDIAPPVLRSPLRRSLERALDTAEEAILTTPPPKEVAEQLAAVRYALDSFRELTLQIADARRQVGGVPDEALRRALAGRLVTHEQELGELTLDNPAALTTLRAAIRAVSEESAKAVEEAAKTAGEGQVGPLGGAPDDDRPPREPLPELGALLGQPISRDPAADARAAARRLWYFNAATLVVAAVGLVPLGFNQLYVARPDFGANPWLDYPALLFWGLGIEGSREAALGLISRRPSGTSSQ